MAIDAKELYTWSRADLVQLAESRLRTIKEGLQVITALETKLKAAEDHAATMETCAKDAEEKLALCKEALENVQLDFVDVKHRLAGSVPFEVFAINCVHSHLPPHDIRQCEYYGTEGGPLYCTPEICQILPKVKT